MRKCGHRRRDCSHVTAALLVWLMNSSNGGRVIGIGDRRWRELVKRGVIDTESVLHDGWTLCEAPTGCFAIVSLENGGNYPRVLPDEEARNWFKQHGQKRHLKIAPAISF